MQEEVCRVSDTLSDRCDSRKCEAVSGSWVECEELLMIKEKQQETKEKIER